MQDESPEGCNGLLTEPTGLDDWLPITEEVLQHRVARPQFRRWGGLTLAFFLGGGVCALFFLSIGPSHVVTHRAVPVSAVGQSGHVVDNATSSTSTVMNVIEVDVHGDVKHPGVYTLPFDARVKDAVKAAGGYLHAADADNVNAASQLTDGAEVVISGPVLSQGPDTSRGPVGAGSPASPSGPSTPSGSSTTNRVDLNTADLATLETLPGIGPARASAIITYRTQHGPFANVSDLTNVSGIGQGILSRIAPYLYVASKIG
ncbi:ComEA family DNA-binding protein [Alicyclobacillus sp. ALC3]|uniref:ComEA family DNA-binding protein n=1 Tax=Alicyclobacillus sp. ALC3 TaxID=2796143 RepID=UPI002378CDC0|nr:ComEA family DNA-binding protein [Alicyclobacillus sp. ALC3]WDL96318.1 ComEA family DNA-binding protein [Alicyclobacillus sp. ALC3]